MHIHGKRMADYTGFVAPRLPRGVFCIPWKRVPSIFIEAKRRRKRSRYRPSLLSLLSPSPLLLPSPTFIHTVLRFSRLNLFLSLFIFSSFLFAYVVPLIVLCRRSRSNGWNLIDLRDPRALLVTRQQAFSFLRGRNRFFVMGRNGSRDPRVWYGIWQHGNRAIRPTDGESDGEEYGLRSVALVL